MVETTIGAASDAGDAFRIGAVFSRAGAIFSRRFPQFVALTAIAWLPQSVLTYIGRSSPDFAANGVVKTVLIALGSILLWGVLTIFSHAIVIQGAFRDMRGSSFGIGESLAAALARFLPLLGMGVILILGLLLGAVLLVFPALMLTAGWYVAAPVCVVERQGPVESLRRSAALTKGHRWKIFGISMVLAIVGGIILKVLTLILGATLGLLAETLGTLVWQALYGAFSAIVVVVLYHDLRVAKEGVDVERIAAVFD